MSERSSSPPEKERTPSSPTLQEPAEFDLRLAMDTIPAIVWTASPDGSDDFFNKNWVEYTNLSVDEAKGFGWLRAIHPDDAPELLARWRAATATATIYECESRVRRFDGEYRWFLSRAVPLRDKSGKVVKWYGTNVDIEDRKRAEARIGQAENDLRLAMDTIPTVVWSAGPDGSADFVSRGWLEYTNLSLEETRGSGWSFAIHPDDRSKFVDKFLKAIAEGTPYEDEGRIRRGDGQYRWFLVRATPFRDPTGAIIRWHGTCTNIEDRKRAEEALRDSEQRFRDFSEASADWYWETGPDHQFTYIPADRPEAANVASPDRIRAGSTRWEIATDVEKDSAKWEEHIAQLNNHRPFRGFVYPVLRQDGSTMYVSVSGIPRFDDNGRFLGYRGGGSDVTAMVRADQAEKSLRQAQVELAHVTRLTTLGELTASIAHEVNQPLAGVIGNGAACLRWLSKDPPQFYGEVRASSRRHDQRCQSGQHDHCENTCARKKLRSPNCGLGCQRRDPGGRCACTTRIGRPRRSPSPGSGRRSRKRAGRPYSIATGYNQSGQEQHRCYGERSKTRDNNPIKPIREQSDCRGSAQFWRRR